MHNVIITAEKLKSELGKALLLDVREQGEFDEGRIEGCKLIPLGELPERAEAELGGDKNRPIVVYCAHGVRSLQGLMFLKSLGFPNVQSLEGGICAWEEAGMPVVR